MHVTPRGFKCNKMVFQENTLQRFDISHHQIYQRARYRSGDEI